MSLCPTVPAPTESAPDDRSNSPAGLGAVRLTMVPDAMLDAALVASLPRAWARSHQVLPVRDGDTVFILTCDPARTEDLQAVALAIGQEARPQAVDETVLLDALERCYARHTESPHGLLASMAETPAASPSIWDAVAVGSESDLLERADSAPVARLVNLILLEAVQQNASDIHFEPYPDRLGVRYRVDGVLYERASPPKHLQQALVSRLKVMARMDIAERRLPQDGMAQVRVGDRAIDIRVSSVPIADGERVVLRLLNRADVFLPLEALGMQPAVQAAFSERLRLSTGLILVSGPTGSGKTTTLYAALGRMDAKRRNIMTIEDPVEYRLPGIGQIQARPKIGLSFAAGLRHVLRQDPDVILVGETRDIETAEIAVRASLTGHLVFTTLHTNDAPSAVMRLIDMGVEPYLLAASLRGVLAQRLVRRLCPQCRLATDWARWSRECDPARAAGLTGLRDQAFFVAHAPGCPSCLEGYSGRLGLFEWLCLTPNLSDAIQQARFDAAHLRDLARTDGFRDLSADGVERVLAGLTDPAEVLGAMAT